jgi:uncharacterized protein (TIGR04222 family)
MSESLADFIRRVEDFEIDPGLKDFTFAARLARENRWSLPFAERVILEYKRFCILAVHSGHPVTPSEQVDQAWHLHLTYTRSYWDRFCGSVLGRPLHHDPTAGGVAEGRKFEDWYAKTLASYQRLFNQRPPVDIWPAPEKRFAPSNDWKWYNAGQHWLMPRPSAAVVSILVTAILMLILPGCTLLLATAAPKVDLQQTLDQLARFPSIAYAALFLHAALTITIVIRVVAKTERLKTTAGQAPPPEETPQAAGALSQLTVEDIAVLAGGARRLAILSLLRLKSRQCLRMGKPHWFLPRTLEPVPGCSPPTDEIDQFVLANLRKGYGVQALVPRLKTHYDTAVRRLQIAGLRYPSRLWSEQLLALACLPLVLCFPLAVAFRQFPAFLFPFAWSLLAVVCCGIANFRSSWVTPAGRRVLKQKQSDAFHAATSADNNHSASGGNTSAFTEPLMLQIALAGTAFAVTLPEFHETASFVRVRLSEHLNTVGSSCGGGCSSSSSSGDGCGSSGGGCAGCGGCGGGGCGGGGCGGGGCGG